VAQPAVLAAARLPAQAVEQPARPVEPAAAQRRLVLAARLVAARLPVGTPTSRST
jgi:hypothetical protein